MKDIFDFLNNETMRNQVYHDHKENMAWVGTTIYISGILLIGIQLNNITYNKALAVIFGVIALLLALTFVGWQFWKRRIAAGKIFGLTRTFIDLNKNHPEDDEVKNLKWVVTENHFYPDFISNQIDDDKHRKDQKITEIISIFSMILAFGVYIVIVV